MSDDKEDCIPEPTQEQLDKITALLIKASDPQRKRLKAVYDGIYGTPPDLIPKHYQNDFIRIRGRLLDDRGYSHEDLMVWIDRYRDHFLLDTDTDTDESFFWPRVYPNGRPVDHHCFIDEIGLLAWLRWCVKDIDEKTAKKQLDVGFSIADAGDIGREIRSKNYATLEDAFIRSADEQWIKRDALDMPRLSIPKMATYLINGFHKTKGSIPKYKDKKPPKQETVEKYLRQAIKDGKISAFKK